MKTQGKEERKRHGGPSKGYGRKKLRTRCYIFRTSVFPCFARALDPVNSKTTRSDFSCQIRSLCKKTTEARSFADASEQNRSSKWNRKGTGPIPGKSTDLMWVG